MSTNPKILFVLTSHSTFKNGKPTGWWAAEAAHPYQIVTDAGFDVVFASPKGGAAPLDPSSVEAAKGDEITTAFLNGDKTKKFVQETIKLSDVNDKDFKAIFWDLAVDPVNIALAEKFFGSGRPLAAVCHGPAALHLVKDPATGKSIFYGRRVTAFSNVEETQVGLVDQIPFLVEDDIKGKGGIYVNEREPWGVEVAVDTTGGTLITGGNPASAGETAKALLRALAQE